MNNSGTSWSGTLGRGLYPPQLLSQVHLRKMTGALCFRKAVSRFTFDFRRGDLAGCTMGKPAVEANLRWSVHEVFRWGEGAYSLAVLPASEAGGDGGQLETAELILDGVRSIPNIFLVEEALDRDGWTVRIADRQPVDTAFQFSPLESFLLSRLDGPTTVEELCQISPVDREETLVGIYVLLCTGVLDSRDNSLFREPLSTTASRDAGLPGTVRSFAGLGPTRPPVEAHPSFSRPRQFEPGLSVVIGRPEPDRWSELTDALNGCAAVAPVAEAGTAGDDPAEVMDMARYHFEKGLEHYAREDFHSAVQLFKLAVRIDDRQAAYHRHLALALSRNPRWGKKAEQALLRALELEPDHAETHYFLGRVYLESGLPARAMARFRESLRLDPDLKPARLELAVINGAARAADREPVSPALLGRISADQGV